VRVGLIDGQYVINPTFAQRKESRLDLIVAGSKDGLVMVEGGSKEVTEEQVVEALEAAHTAIKKIVAVIDDLAKAAGKKKVATPKKKDVGHEFYREVEERVLVPLSEAMRIRGKLENYEQVEQVLSQLVASIPEGEVERRTEAKSISRGPQGKSAARRGPSTAMSGWMDESSTRFVRSGLRRAFFRACTALPSSRVARHRRSSPARSARLTMRRRLKS
jgi:polyribonucleotide nucleotidyltransferase